MTGKRLNSFKPARENSLIVRAARFIFAGIKRLVFAGGERFADQLRSGG